MPPPRIPIQNYLPAIAACLLFAACRPASPPTRLPPPEAHSWIHEDDTSPLPRPRIEVVGLQQEESADGAVVTLTGTLVNRGEGPTAELTVTVNGLDEAGGVITSARAMPASERVAPGSTVNFTATMVNRPDIRNYHVEAIAR